jgi:hypothetical protein
VSAEDAAASEAIVHEIERVSAGLDAVDEELGETPAEAAEAEAAEPVETTPVVPPAAEADAQRASDEAAPPA